MSGKLIILDKYGKEKNVYPVSKLHVFIGSEFFCDIRFKNVCPQQCLITVQKDKPALIRNLSSAFPTLVNGKEIGIEDIELQHEDVINIRNKVFLWRYDDSSRSSVSNVSQKDRKSWPLFRNKLVAVVSPHRRDDEKELPLKKRRASYQPDRLNASTSRAKVLAIKSGVKGKKSSLLNKSNLKISPTIVTVAPAFGELSSKRKSVKFATPYRQLGKRGKLSKNHPSTPYRPSTTPGRGKESLYFTPPSTLGSAKKPVKSILKTPSSVSTLGQPSSSSSLKSRIPEAPDLSSSPAGLPEVQDETDLERDRLRTPPREVVQPGVVMRSSKKTASLVLSSPESTPKSSSKKTKRLRNDESLESSERAAKKLKQEPPRAIDKKKMAALLLCHRKSLTPHPEIKRRGRPLLSIVSDKSQSFKSTPTKVNLVETSRESEETDEYSMVSKTKRESLDNADSSMSSSISKRRKTPFKPIKLEKKYDLPKTSVAKMSSSPSPPIRKITRAFRAARVSKEPLRRDVTDVLSALDLSRKLPINDSTEVSKKTTSPIADFTNVSGIKKLFSTDKTLDVRELFLEDSIGSSPNRSSDKSNRVVGVEKPGRLSRRSSLLKGNRTVSESIGSEMEGVHELLSTPSLSQSPAKSVQSIPSTSRRSLTLKGPRNSLAAKESANSPQLSDTEISIKNRTPEGYKNDSAKKKTSSIKKQSASVSKVTNADVASEDESFDFSLGSFNSSRHKSLNSSNLSVSPRTPENDSKILESPKSSRSKSAKSLKSLNKSHSVFSLGRKARVSLRRVILSASTPKALHKSFSSQQNISTDKDNNSSFEFTPIVDSSDNEARSRLSRSPKAKRSKIATSPDGLLSTSQRRRSYLASQISLGPDDSSLSNYSLKVNVGSVRDEKNSSVSFTKVNRSKSLTDKSTSSPSPSARASSSAPGTTEKSHSSTFSQQNVHRPRLSRKEKTMIERSELEPRSTRSSSIKPTRSKSLVNINLFNLGTQVVGRKKVSKKIVTALETPVKKMRVEDSLSQNLSANSSFSSSKDQSLKSSSIKGKQSTEREDSLILKPSPSLKPTDKSEINSNLRKSSSADSSSRKITILSPKRLSRKERSMIEISETMLKPTRSKSIGAKPTRSKSQVDINLFRLDTAIIGRKSYTKKADRGLETSTNEKTARSLSSQNLSTNTSFSSLKDESFKSTSIKGKRSTELSISITQKTSSKSVEKSEISLTLSRPSSKDSSSHKIATPSPKRLSRKEQSMIEKSETILKPTRSKSIGAKPTRSKSQVDINLFRLDTAIIGRKSYTKKADRGLETSTNEKTARSLSSQNLSTNTSFSSLKDESFKSTSIKGKRSTELGISLTQTSSPSSKSVENSEISLTLSRPSSKDSSSRKITIPSPKRLSRKERSMIEISETMLKPTRSKSIGAKPTRSKSQVDINLFNLGTAIIGRKSSTKKADRNLETSANEKMARSSLSQNLSEKNLFSPSKEDSFKSTSIKSKRSTILDGSLSHKTSPSSKSIKKIEVSLATGRPSSADSSSHKITKRLNRKEQTMIETSEPMLKQTRSKSSLGAKPTRSKSLVELNLFNLGTHIVGRKQSNKKVPRHSGTPTNDKSSIINISQRSNDGLLTHSKRSLSAPSKVMNRAETPGKGKSTQENKQDSSFKSISSKSFANKSTRSNSYLDLNLFNLDNRSFKSPTSEGSPKVHESANKSMTKSVSVYKTPIKNKASISESSLNKTPIEQNLIEKAVQSGEKSQLFRSAVSLSNSKSTRSTHSIDIGLFNFNKSPLVIASTPARGGKLRQLSEISPIKKTPILLSSKSNASGINMNRSEKESRDNKKEQSLSKSGFTSLINKSTRSTSSVDINLFSLDDKKRKSSEVSSLVQKDLSGRDSKKYASNNATPVLVTNTNRKDKILLEKSTKPTRSSSTVNINLFDLDNNDQRKKSNSSFKGKRSKSLSLIDTSVSHVVKSDESRSKLSTSKNMLVDSSLKKQHRSENGASLIHAELKEKGQHSSNKQKSQKDIDTFPKETRSQSLSPVKRASSSRKSVETLRKSSLKNVSISKSSPREEGVNKQDKSRISNRFLSSEIDPAVYDYVSCNSKSKVSIKKSLSNEALSSNVLKLSPYVRIKPFNIEKLHRNVKETQTPISANYDNNKYTQTSTVKKVVPDSRKSNILSSIPVMDFFNNATPVCDYGHKTKSVFSPTKRLLRQKELDESDRTPEGISSNKTPLSAVSLKGRQSLLNDSPRSLVVKHTQTPKTISDRKLKKSVSSVTRSSQTLVKLPEPQISLAKETKSTKVKSSLKGKRSHSYNKKTNETLTKIVSSLVIESTNRSPAKVHTSPRTILTEEKKTSAGNDKIQDRVVSSLRGRKKDVSTTSRSGATKKTGQAAKRSKQNVLSSDLSPSPPKKAKINKSKEQPGNAIDLKGSLDGNEDQTNVLGKRARDKGPQITVSDISPQRRTRRRIEESTVDKKGKKNVKSSKVSAITAKNMPITSNDEIQVSPLRTRGRLAKKVIAEPPAQKKQTKADHQSQLIIASSLAKPKKSLSPEVKSKRRGRPSVSALKLPSSSDKNIVSPVVQSSHGKKKDKQIPVIKEVMTVKSPAKRKTRSNKVSTPKKTKEVTSGKTKKSEKVIPESPKKRGRQKANPVPDTSNSTSNAKSNSKAKTAISVIQKSKSTDKSNNSPVVQAAPGKKKGKKIPTTTEQQETGKSAQRKTRNNNIVSPLKEKGKDKIIKAKNVLEPKIVPVLSPKRGRPKADPSMSTDNSVTNNKSASKSSKPSNAKSRGRPSLSAKKLSHTPDKTIASTIVTKVAKKGKNKEVPAAKSVETKKSPAKKKLNNNQVTAKKKNPSPTKKISLSKDLDLMPKAKRGRPKANPSIDEGSSDRKKTSVAKSPIKSNSKTKKSGKTSVSALKSSHTANKSISSPIVKRSPGKRKGKQHPPAKEVVTVVSPAKKSMRGNKKLTSEEKGKSKKSSSKTESTPRSKPGRPAKSVAFKIKSPSPAKRGKKMPPTKAQSGRGGKKAVKK